MRFLGKSCEDVMTWKRFPHNLLFMRENINHREL